PGRRDIVGRWLAYSWKCGLRLGRITPLLEQQLDVVFAHETVVPTLPTLAQQLVEVRDLQIRNGFLGKIGLRLEDVTCRGWRSLQHAGETAAIATFKFH